MYFGLIFFVMLLVPAVTAPLCIRKYVSPYRTLCISVLISFIGCLLVIAAVKAGGMSLGEMYTESIKNMAPQIAASDEISAQAGIGTLTYDERVDMIIRAYSGMNSMFPAVILMMSTAVSYTVYNMAAALMKRSVTDIKTFPHIRDFRWQSGVILGFGFMMILALIVERSVPVFRTLNIAMNINLLFEYAVALQGLAVVLSVFYRKNISKILSVLIVIVGFFTNPGRMVLFTIGTFDFIFNVKKRM